MKREAGKRTSAVKSTPIPGWVKALLDLAPAGTAILTPKRLSEQFVDPVPPPIPDFTNPKYLDQVSLGRWIDTAPGAKANELEVAFRTLAEFIARRAETYLFPNGATDEQQRRFVDVLHASYSRGFYLALLRYADDLKAVPEAAAILKAMRSGPSKAGEVIRKKAAPKRMDVRRRFRELRKSGFNKTEARRIIHQDTGFSIRQIERDTAGLS